MDDEHAPDDENAPDDDTVADADLVLRTRSGDTAAFGELWSRHYRSGITVARNVTSSIDPDDLVQESYTRIYQAIIKGGGPNGSFRAYLFTSIRNTAAAWGRSRRESAIDELDTVADPGSTEQASNDALDRSLTAQAFRSLPNRWQEVLWYTEIEQMKPVEVAPLLGMKAGAVSQLAFRAREGLREAWIQAHLRSAAPDSECQWTIEHLGAYSRHNLSTRDRRRLELHLDECARCTIVAAEAKDVSQHLALVLLPLVLGITGAAGYLATLQGGGTPIVALAAMPSGVIDGGVVAGTGHAGTAGTAAGGASGGASSGLFTGMGALVGAGSAALIVAGVVAVSAVLSHLAQADEAAVSPPHGAASTTAPFAWEKVPDAATPTPAPEESATPEETVPPTAAPEAPTPVIAPPPAAPAPPPAAPDPAPQPAPIDAPDIVSSRATCTWVNAGNASKLETTYRITVKGKPRATVQPFLDRNSRYTTSTVLDANGRGVVVLRPTITQVTGNAMVRVRYAFLNADGVRDFGPFKETLWLSDLATPVGTSCVTP